MTTYHAFCVVMLHKWPHIMLSGQWQNMAEYLCTGVCWRTGIPCHTDSDRSLPRWRMRDHTPPCLWYTRQCLQRQSHIWYIIYVVQHTTSYRYFSPATDWLMSIMSRYICWCLHCTQSDVMTRSGAGWSTEHSDTTWHPRHGGGMLDMIDLDSHDINPPFYTYHN